jgi:hypothetical protein
VVEIGQEKRPGCPRTFLHFRGELVKFLRQEHRDEEELSSEVEFCDIGVAGIHASP